MLAGIDEYALVDADDTIIGVHGYGKQGSGYGYSGVRGLIALLAVITTGQAAPVIAPTVTEGIVRIGSRRQAAGR